MTYLCLNSALTYSLSTVLFILEISYIFYFCFLMQET